ncbi:acyl-CoA synthetase [Sphingobium sp. CFD-2]|uniref:acyl-CoA synthetase n=1 Tax=Sphingobium sp. CFD-2 TaxID=2878542 RepID=UPI00214B349C|nr:acyl-CoA synthetase [Sphingobium sp. CFD-2]
MQTFHPHWHAKAHPAKLAYKFIPSGKCATYAELEARSNQASQLMRAYGLQRGDVIGIFMENLPEYFELTWAADRAGIYFTGISTRLTADELAYIVKDSGAKMLFSCDALADVAIEALRGCQDCVGFTVDTPVPGLRSYVAERDTRRAVPVDDPSRGMPMLYSSGTTGRPKGVQFPLPDLAMGDLDPLGLLLQNAFGFGADSIYLSPAPLYHAAPLRFNLGVHRLGGTSIIMEKYDAELALQVIEEEAVTHSQWVPTHFVRMLKLPEEVRTRYDLTSHKFAVHAAAPCPVDVKRDMLDWWGPIIFEYYSATEFNGMTLVAPADWRNHPGTVGRAVLGKPHILSDDGTELPPRSEGLVYFEDGTLFEYHNDPVKTAEAYNDKGWSTLGDIGWLDEDGYLYLTDRKSYMIISGGVNIYPQEIEDRIITHPKVVDAAVIGAPDEDFGERVIAVVQPLDWSDAGPALVEDLQQHLAATLSKIKIPRQIDFMQELPRQPNGKLYKRLLKDSYIEKARAVN